MRIAVNARFLLKDKLEGIGMVTDEVMKRIVRHHPEDQFDYYFDRKYDERFIHAANVTPHVFPPVTRLPILMRWWMNYPVRHHIRRSKADVFFSTDGFFPLGMRTPKVAMVHDVAFLRYPEHLPLRHRLFYQKWMPRYLAYANHIITVSEFSKKELIEGYRVPADKISVVYNGITDAYKPLDEAQKTFVRNNYAKGKPYFVYLGAIHPRKNILTLIRAFELFKANAPSDIQLVIAGRNAWKTDDVYQAVDVSPVKDAIHLPGYVVTEKAAGLVASAEAMIYPSVYEGFGLPLVEAMACGVPVITSNVTSLPEVAGEAALLFDPMDPGYLSQHMHTITSNQAERDRLIELGFERKKMFSWDNSAEEIYAILKRIGG